VSFVKIWTDEKNSRRKAKCAKTEALQSWQLTPNATGPKHQCAGLCEPHIGEQLIAGFSISLEPVRFHFYFRPETITTGPVGKYEICEAFNRYQQVSVDLSRSQATLPDTPVQQSGRGYPAPIF
jgi:hypothetical protein